MAHSLAEVKLRHHYGQIDYEEYEREMKNEEEERRYAYFEDKNRIMDEAIEMHDHEN